MADEEEELGTSGHEVEHSYRSQRKLTALTQTRNQTVARPRFQKPNPTLNPGTYQLANRGPLYLVGSYR